MEEKLYPKIGIAVWLTNSENKVLMMKRQGSHGAGTWAPPGGKLEMGESFLGCATREVKEEADIDITDIEFVGLTNDVFSPEKHYATVFVKAKNWSGTAKNMEPKKCTEIGWYDIHNLPTPQFLTGEHLFESDFLCLCRSGKKFKDCYGKM